MYEVVSRIYSQHDVNMFHKNSSNQNIQQILRPEKYDSFEDVSFR